MDFLQNTDRTVAVFFSGTNCRIADIILAACSSVAEFGIIYILIIAALFVFGKERRNTLILGTSLVSAFTASHLLKLCFNRPRPYIELGLNITVSDPIGSSFPSAHSAVAFAFAIPIFILYIKKNKPFALINVLFACVVAFSRIWLCVHYLSDVLTGALLGVVSGISTIFIYRLVFKKYDLLKKRKEHKT